MQRVQEWICSNEFTVPTLAQNLTIAAESPKRDGGGHKVEMIDQHQGLFPNE